MIAVNIILLNCFQLPQTAYKKDKDNELNKVHVLQLVERSNDMIFTKNHTALLQLINVYGKSEKIIFIEWFFNNLFSGEDCSRPFKVVQGRKDPGKKIIIKK